MTSNVTVTTNLTTKKGRVTDTTDYAALGVDPTTFSLRSFAVILFQGEILFSKVTFSDPLINFGDGDTFFEFDLELDGNGDVANGVYEVNNYQVCASAAGLSTFDSTTSIITLNGVGDLAAVINENDILSVLTGVNTGEKILESAESVSGVFIATSKTALTTAGSTVIQYRVLYNSFADHAYTYSGCTQLQAGAVLTYDCEYGDFGTWAVSNTTPITDQTLVSLDATITWPPLTGLDPIVVTELPYSNNTLARGTYSITLSEVIQQTQADGLIIEYTATFADEFPPVVCVTKATICGLMNCFNHLLQAHLGAIASAKTSPYQASYDAAVGELNKYYVYKSCSETAKANLALAELQVILDSTGCDCGCGGGGGSSDPSGSIWVVNTATTVITAAQVTYSRPDNIDVIGEVTDVKEALDEMLVVLQSLVP